MTATPAAHRGRRAVATILLWLLVVIVCWGFAWVVAPDANAGGQCEGLGFGCTLTPQDSLALVAFFAAPVGVGTVLLGTVVALVVDRARWLPRLGGAALGTLCALCGLVLALVLAATLVALR